MTLGDAWMAVQTDCRHLQLRINIPPAGAGPITIRYSLPDENGFYFAEPYVIECTDLAEGLTRLHGLAGVGSE